MYSIHIIFVKCALICGDYSYLDPEGEAPGIQVAVRPQNQCITLCYQLSFHYTNSSHKNIIIRKI